MKIATTVTLALDAEVAQKLAAALFHTMNWARHPWALELHNLIVEAVDLPTQVDDDMARDIREYLLTELRAEAEEDDDDDVVHIEDEFTDAERYYEPVKRGGIW